jgi:hypothetical protein
LGLRLVDLHGQLLHNIPNHLVLHVLLPLEIVLFVRLLLLVGQSPADNWVLGKSLQDSKETLLVLPQYLHDHLASYSKKAMDAGHTHCFLQHPG